MSGDAYRWLAAKAAEAKLMNSADISGYVRELALLQILPKQTTKHWPFDTRPQAVSYTTFNVDGTKDYTSTLTISNSLLRYLNVENNGGGALVLGRMANDIRKSKTDKRRDVSQRVRERLIYDIYNKYHGERLHFLRAPDEIVA